MSAIVITDLPSFFRRMQQNTGMLTLQGLTPAERAAVQTLIEKRRVVCAGGGYLVPTGPAINYVVENDLVLEALPAIEEAKPAPAGA